MPQPIPPELGAAMSPEASLQSGLGNILNSVANAINTATQALETVKGLVNEGTATATKTLNQLETEHVAPKMDSKPEVCDLELDHV
ncbi:hypothetical protein F0U60_50355 [Archangium minus]|uniref:Uncharacterized protein n=1 Tax=Archangium minus TaxID=83450 RepID=A0ABY9X7R1_9BACT|nr:hypothetical protein F0U60_50355 [Archangium minus]